MKINILADENSIIISWTSYPIDENKPILEIQDPETIHLGFDKFIEGKLVRDSKNYKKALLLHEKSCRIDTLKKKLSESDYKLFKYLEGELSEDEYQKVKADRQSWRTEINQLEEELK